MEQRGSRGTGRRVLALPLHFQKQLRFVQNPLSQGSRRVTPGGVQLPGFACRPLTAGEDFRHSLAVFAADLGHRRQKLHRQVRRDLAHAHSLLNFLGEQFDQGQPSRHPTGTAIEAARQLLHTIAEATLQFFQQPSFLQSRHPPRRAQGMLQQHRLEFARRPDYGLHRVAAQLLQSLNALKAIDHQVAIRLARDDHHDDGNLLAVGGQRCQQTLLPIGAARAPVLPTPIELMKLQMHGNPGSPDLV
jgi:hypothetical protein